MFVLNRPVLYWVLYQDIENSNHPGIADGAERNLVAWVLNSCYTCIESAKLIVFNLTQSNVSQVGTFETPVLSWREAQLLIGAYAVLLSVQTASQFSPQFREQQEIDMVLDMAESAMACAAPLSLAFVRSLELLTNIRQGFQNPSPIASC